MRQRLWQIVSSERFVNTIHDIEHNAGMAFVIVYVYWLFERK